VHYVFKDNGRGPDFAERIERAPDGRVIPPTSNGATLR